MSNKERVMLERSFLQARSKELNDKSRRNKGLSEKDCTEWREILFKLRNLNVTDGCLFQE